MKPETRSDQKRSEYDRITKQSLIEKHGAWIFDALSIVQQLGGIGKIWDKDERKYTDREIQVENFCAKNGICYSIRTACLLLPQAGWNFLAQWLTPVQYSKAEEMQKMDKLEFMERTEDLVHAASQRYSGLSKAADLQTLLVETTKSKIGLRRNGA
jgi:hypothetical protein